MLSKKGVLVDFNSITPIAVLSLRIAPSAFLLSVRFLNSVVILKSMSGLIVYPKTFTKISRKNPS